MARKIRTPLLALVVVFVLAALAVLVVFVGRTPLPPPLPNPNGFDDLIKAGVAVLGKVDDVPTIDHDGLRALVSTNSEALRLLRLGLSRRCVMPESALTNFLGSMNPMKRLVMLVEQEGRVSEMENRLGDAARSYTEAVCLGNEMSRGGFLMTRRLGIASEEFGCDGLAKLLPKLTRDEARIALKELEDVEAKRVTLAGALQNERFYTRHQATTRVNPIAWAKDWWQSWHAVQRAKNNHKIMVAQVRLLATELALKCYQFDQRRPPTQLDALVPSYLSQVPQDPFTGQPLVYRLQGTNWLLYSLGPNGVDASGKPVSQSFSVNNAPFLGGEW